MLLIHVAIRRRAALGYAAVLVSLSIGLAVPIPAPAVEPRVAGAKFDDGTSIAYPASPAIIDVTKSPYHAKGDGVADDTEALQRALSDVMGRHKLLYLPNGTYLISKTLMWSKKNSAGQDAWGKNFIQGQNARRTVIRLKDGTFPDPKQPGAIMWCGGFGSADWFHNYVQDLTFEVGNHNPGAIALQFYSNNSGAVRNCRFVAPAGSGLIGLDLAHRDMNGPLLVRNCEVVGFERGISTARAVNGQTFEQITLRGQTRFGFTNEGQAISVRGLLSENATPAIQSYGLFCLIEARLRGLAGADQVPAIVNYNGGRIYLRDIATTGYRRAVADVVTPDSAAAFRISGPDKPGSEGPNVVEYSSHPATSPFSKADFNPTSESKPASGVKRSSESKTATDAANSSSPASAVRSLRLPIKDPPELPVDDPRTWANVDAFGADPTAQQDSSAAIQKAIDSGATTIFLPGSYALTSTVVVRGNVRRVIGVGGMVDYFRKVQPDFRIADGASPVVLFEHLAYIHGGIEIDTKRKVVFRSVADCDLISTDNAKGGELYFEDFVTHDLKLNGQRVWARQLNVENEGEHIVNDGGDLWVLGYKTERGGTLLKTQGGGRSEILGGFSYTTTAGKLGPKFVNNDSSVFAFFGEVCYSGDPFATLIRETRRGQTKVVNRGEGTTTPYVSPSP